MGNNNCTKGKSCGSACVAPSYKCVKSVPSLNALTKVLSEKEPRTKATLAKEEKLKKTIASLVEEKQQFLETDHLTAVLATNKQILQTLDKIEGTQETLELKEKIKGEEEFIKARIKQKSEEQEIRDSRQEEAKLSYEERGMIRRYTSGEEGQYSDDSSFQNINRCLRNPARCPDKAKTEPHIKLLDQTLAKLPKNQEGHEFYRGVNVNSPYKAEQFEQLRESSPGTIFRDTGFGSYSAEKRVALGYNSRSAKNILFISRSVNLTPVNVFSEISSEKEAILPRGIDQVIKEVSLNGNTLIVELE